MNQRKISLAQNQIAKHLSSYQQNLDPYIKNVVLNDVLKNKRISRSSYNVQSGSIHHDPFAHQNSIVNRQNNRTPHLGRRSGQKTAHSNPQTSSSVIQPILDNVNFSKQPGRTREPVLSRNVSTVRSSNIGKNRSTKPIEKIVLPFKVAIMVHLYDSKKVTNSLLVSILKLLDRYDRSCFHWYFNIANTVNASQLKAMIDSLVKGQTEHLSVMFNQNRGGDIGGFILLCKEVTQSPQRYGYCYFFHTKTNNNWRTSLVRPVTSLKLESLDEIHDLGLIGAKKHLHHFTYHQNCHYEYHLLNLSRLTKVPLENDDSWYFIGGTIFLANSEVINFIGQTDTDLLFRSLNTADTVDVNWQAVVGDHLKKNLKGTNNDYQYRHIYKTSLHSDFMIEHTFERFIGWIVKHLKLKVYGAGS